MKEKYIGSVRFYKNLILAVIIILIVVPVIFAFVLKNKNDSLESRVTSLEQEVQEAESRVNEIESEGRTVSVTDENGKTITMVVE